jgi:SpoVK/Ycf46/Vps4 family AAA+-type ATPase
MTIAEKISLSAGLSDRMLVKHKAPFSLFSMNFKMANKPLLTPENFPHLQQEIESLDCYLTQSIGKNKTGINILLYGVPGSGKSEFTRMLAARAGLNLFEIACDQKNGAPMSSSGRLQSYMLTQSVLEKSARPMIMFDEVEDVFNNADASNDWGSNDKGNTSGQKAWMNGLLENNSVPTFWISNDIGMIDPAHLRRFDYHMEMKAPPRNVRLQIIDEYTSELPVSGAWRNVMADHDKVSPAVIEKAKKFATAVLNHKPELSAESLMTHVISNSLQAMGLGEIKTSPNHDLLNYKLDVVNASCDLDELSNGLSQHSEARLCLYGPPGTGKTAFGHHLAKLLDKPLLVKRSSDILSPYLGMTERNMAKMFREAQSTNSILLLDEADSFLRDRSGARHSWEVTAVNEMLTQMETFNGIFIASTNLMDQLDAASLRRFDMKIEFGYLKSEQSCNLLEDLAAKLSISLVGDEIDGLRQLSNLTPGDFANVARQSKLTRINDGQELINRLSNESKTKLGNRSGKMGFIT